MFQPLKGVKVIDLTYFVAGPGAARILADWGADVIKVEPGFGDPGRGTGATMSCPTKKDCNPFYTIYNMNKRGIALNLKKEEGKAILDKILETADVFVSRKGYQPDQSSDRLRRCYDLLLTGRRDLRSSLPEGTDRQGLQGHDLSVRSGDLE